MKIKQIGPYNGDIIQTIIKNRNVEDIDLFLNPTDDDNISSLNLHNMKAGTEMLLAHMIIDNHIGLLVDPDADGFSSATIMYRYMKKMNPDAKITYFLHDKKSHGLTENILDQIAKTDIDIMVIPDAASNDNESLKRLYHMGIEVLILDHHEVDEYPEVGLLINNQLEQNTETNHHLVGAGMVFKFCQALDEMLRANHSEEFYDLVAIGQIGDASDITQNEIRSMVFKGLGTLSNPFVLTVLEDHFDNIEEIVPKDLSFSIIPLINAVVRVGTMEEKDLMFRALCGIGADETFNVIKKKKNKQTGKFDKFEVEQNLYEYARDICKKVKGRQAALVKKIMESLTKEIDNSGGIAIGILESSDHGTITGLVANKLVQKLQKPVLLIYKDDKEDKFVGSGRGYDKVLPSLRDWCNNTELVEFAQGHANAFGISIFKKDLEAFKDKTKNVENEDFVYNVDLIVEENIDKDLILEIDKHKYLFGGTFHEAQLAFTGIKVNKKFIRQRGSMLTFFDRGVEFVMYGAPVGLYESLTQNFDPFITMDFVGRPSKNTWGGRETPQLVLDDCERNEPSPSPKKEKLIKILEVTAETIIF